MARPKRADLWLGCYAMVRWIVVLVAACLVSGVVGFGGLGFVTAGLARTLFAVFAGLLGISLVVGIIRGSWTGALHVAKARSLRSAEETA